MEAQAYKETFARGLREKTEGMPVWTDNRGRPAPPLPEAALEVNRIYQPARRTAVYAEKSNSLTDSRGSVSPTSKVTYDLRKSAFKEMSNGS